MTEFQIGLIALAVFIAALIRGLRKAVLLFALISGCVILLHGT